MKSTLFSLLAIAIITSCNSKSEESRPDAAIESKSEELTRNAAMEIIKNSSAYPKNISIELLKSNRQETYSAEYSQEQNRWFSIIKNLSEQNLLSQSFSDINPGYPATGQVVNIVIKPEGEKYILKNREYHYELLAHQIGVKEIKGIISYTQPNKYAQVNFTTEIINQTPFDQLYDYSRNRQNSEASVKIVKYDDGWRIEK